MAKVTAVTTVFPHTGLLRFLLGPKTQIKLHCTLKMPDGGLSLLLLPCGGVPPGWGVVCRVVTGDLTRGRCARAVQKHPLRTTTVPPL